MQFSRQFGSVTKWSRTHQTFWDAQLESRRSRVSWLPPWYDIPSCHWFCSEAWQGLVYYPEHAHTVQRHSVHMHHTSRFKHHRILWLHGGIWGNLNSEVFLTPGESDSAATAIVQSNEQTRSGPPAVCIAMDNVTSEPEIVEGHIVSSDPVKEVVKKNDTLASLNISTHSSRCVSSSYCRFRAFVLRIYHFMHSNSESPPSFRVRKRYIYQR
jgi:hypothetical protein